MSELANLKDAWRESSNAYRDLIVVIDHIDGIPDAAVTAAKKAIVARNHALELEEKLYG